MKAPAVIAHKFKVERLLGQGGMGQVYLARDPRLGDRRVAIKLLRVDNEEARHRFEQEAAAAANLHHRNTVVIYEYGDHEGQPYIAMEFIEGDPLSIVIQQRRPLSIRRKLELLDDLCARLGFAHGQGIVHRDVKPGNLLLDREGCLKVVDFGIARAQSGSRFTVGLIGTPNYMSPEQVNGEPIDRRSDIFAVGLVAYELLSYRMAFPGESGRVYDLIRYNEPESLESIVSDCDPRLAALVRRALAKKPQDRYQQLEQMRAELETIRDAPEGSSSKPPPDDIETIVQKRTPTPSPAVDRAALARRRQRILDDHLAAGRAALENGDFDAAVERFEEAASIDEENAATLELLERARQLVAARQVKELLDLAEAELGESRLGEAAELVARAQAIDAGDARIGQVQEAIAKARAIESALALARTHLTNNAADAALRAASEALAHDPSNLEALELTRRALKWITEKQRQTRRKQQAQETVARALSLAREGRFDAALELLEAFQPAEDAIVTALTEIRQQQSNAVPAVPEPIVQIDEGVAAGDSAGPEPVAAALDGRQGKDPAEDVVSTDAAETQRAADTLFLVSRTPDPTPVKFPAEGHSPPERSNNRSRVFAAAAIVLIIVASYAWVSRDPGTTTPAVPPTDIPAASSPPAGIPGGGVATQTPADVNQQPVNNVEPVPAPPANPAPPAAVVPPRAAEVGTTDAPARPTAPRLAAASSAYAERRFAAAAQIYQEILADAPRDRSAAAGLANARQARARQLQAVKDLIDKGDALRGQRSYDQAIEAFQAALAEDPESRPAADKSRKHARRAGAPRRRLLTSPLKRLLPRWPRRRAHGS